MAYRPSWVRILFAGLPVFLGSLTRVLFEDLGKIMHIHNAAVLGNGLDLQPGVSQKMLCVVDPTAVDKVCDGLSRFLFEQRRQIAAADIQGFR